jgi:hypothetical protein
VQVQVQAKGSGGDCFVDLVWSLGRGARQLSSMGKGEGGRGGGNKTK